MRDAGMRKECTALYCACTHQGLTRDCAACGILRVSESPEAHAWSDFMEPTGHRPEGPSSKRGTWCRRLRGTSVHGTAGRGALQAPGSEEGQNGLNLRVSSRAFPTTSAHHSSGRCGSAWIRTQRSMRSACSTPPRRGPASWQHSAARPLLSTLLRAASRCRTSGSSRNTRQSCFPYRFSASGSSLAGFVMLRSRR